LSLRVQRAEGDTPQGGGGGEEITLRYEVARLKRENNLLHEELRLLKRVEGLTKLPPPPERKTPSPKRRREKKRERERRERRQKISSSSSDQMIH